MSNNPEFTIETPNGVTVDLQGKWQYSEIIPLAEHVKLEFAFIGNLLEKAVARLPDHRNWFVNIHERYE
jgi:1-phosphatidylinositol phosphodiesterase